MEATAEAPQVEQATPTEAPAKPILPRCPHCGADPLTITMMSQLFPKGQIASLMFCGNLDCRKLLTAQIVGMIDQPGTIVRPGQPRIVP